MNERPDSRWISEWEPPVSSEWVEKEFGRALFANAWEAYAGGIVVDVYSRADRAQEALRDTLRMLEGVRVRREELRVEWRRAISFAGGGRLLFLCAADVLDGHALEGMRPTRVDPGPFLPREWLDWLRRRGVEIV